MSETTPVEAPAAVEAPVTEPAPVETPATEPAVVEPVAPVYDWADESIQTRAAEALTHLEKWGSPDDVNRALEIDRALKTEEGITGLFVQAGRALGLTPEQMDALFAPAETAPAEVEEVDPDRVLTWKEAQELFQKQLAEAQTKTTAEQAQERQVEVARTTVNETLAALGVTEQAEVEAVLAAGQRHLADGDFDPAHITAAVRKGFADYEKAARARAEKYLQGKITNAQTLPGSIGANPPGGVELPEPQNVDEAKARARARLRGAS